MQLPADLRAAAEGFAAGLPFADLKRAAALLSERYREGAPTGRVQLAPAFRVAAYMVTRFPATYAAVAAALREAPWTDVESVVDLGAGPGAAALAARARWPEAAEATLVESDPAFAEAGRKLIAGARWIERDLRSMAEVPEGDVVIASYGLGELGEDHAMRIARAAWEASRKGVVFVEPGTSRGFGLIRKLRELGGRIAAPCPVAGPCPVSGSDWCHFAARVERSSMHRRLKDASLGHEDEKFSYVILSKEPVAGANGARLVRHPRHHAGFIELRVCEGGSLADVTVSKRDKGKFRAARKAEWGDLLRFDPQVVLDLEDA